MVWVGSAPDPAGELTALPDLEPGKNMRKRGYGKGKKRKGEKKTI